MASQVPRFSFTNGLSIPAIGLGTWKSAPGQVEEAVRVAVDVGYRHIDCAHVYGNEAEVGQGIQSKVAEGAVERKDLFVTSKLWNTFHRPDLVVPACRRSLQLLNLDYLDLYLIHWPFAFQEGGNLIPQDESGAILLSDVDYVDTWRELERCVEAGLVRSLGLSNFNSQQVARVLENCSVRPVNLQVECNPYLNQSKLRTFCKERDIVVTAYSPLGSSDSPYFKPGTPKVLEDPKLHEIAKHVGKTVAQVILRYLVQQGMATVPKSVTASRIRDNISIFDFELSDDDIASIDSLNQDLRICHRDHAKDHKHYPF